MNIQLKPEHEKFIQAQIASGGFSESEEIVDIAFELLEKLNDD